MAVADDGPSNTDDDTDPHLESREPTLEDLRDLDYAEAVSDVIVHDVGGVPIPFASPRLLWRMKVVTHREKDAADLVFLRYWFAERGEEPPAPRPAPEP